MAKNDSALDLVYDAYRRLTHDQLVLFLRVRSLPTTGTDADLAHRLSQYDIHTYPFPTLSNGLTPPAAPLGDVMSKQRLPRQSSIVSDLPVEILSEILDHLGDWELSKAVGVPTSIPRPLEWTRSTSMDEAILTGYLPVIRAADPAFNHPTRIGATLTIRFGYIHVLDLFLTCHRTVFLSVFGDDLIPIVASHHSRTEVLKWWKHAIDHAGLPLPKSSSIIEVIDGASRTGAVASLEWWHASSLPMEYTEAALEYASAKNHISVLAWWKQSGLPLKIGRVMDLASTAGHVNVLEWWARSQLEFKYDRHALHHASYHGRVEVLQWWLGSGLQLIFDGDVLTGATRHNRPEVLEWWDRSGLPVQYRMCDVEEALEDAIGGGEAAREWWRKKGVDFNANDKEWMKLQTLN